MSDLLPCPFCNSVDAPSVHSLKIGHRGGYSFGWCAPDYGGCGARSGVQSTKGAAASAWNRRAPADPALLALARLGARLCRAQLSPTGGFCHTRYEHLDRIGIEEGVLMPGHLDSTGPVIKPGIADAIARLLAPDGAGEVAP